MTLSTAVGTERISRVVGYQVLKGAIQESSPNLPMRIAVFGQANTAQQTGLSILPQQITSEAQAGELYGFGSMIHIMSKILLPARGGGVGGIPVIVYPQDEPSAGAARVTRLSIGGAVAGTGPETHTIRVNGRTAYETVLEYTVNNADTPADVYAAIIAAVNASLSVPVIASAVAADAGVDFTTKFQGAVTNDLEIEVDSGDNNANITYTIAQETAGAGASTAEINTSLAQFGEEWNTIVINPYGESENTTFEAFNGVPGADNPTGRYAGTVFKPFMALFGKLAAANGSNEITNLNRDQGTVVQCPAPNSKGWSFEAAANVAVLLARQAQDTPHLDTAGRAYPDMPVPLDGDIGVYASYNDRDILVKGGASTVNLINGRYVIEDLVTSYRPVGEEPPQFRYPRSLIQDWNVRYGYFLLEQINVVDHSIAEDAVPVRVARTVKPKQWIGILRAYADDLARRNIIVEPDFMKESIQVATSLVNPDRLETFFRYKRSPFTRIASTTAEANFAFGLT